MSWEPSQRAGRAEVPLLSPGHRQPAPGICGEVPANLPLSWKGSFSFCCCLGPALSGAERPPPFTFSCRDGFGSRGSSARSSSVRVALLGRTPLGPHCRAPAPSRSLLLLLASLPRGEGTVPCQGERSNSGLSEGQRIAPLSRHQRREQILCPPPCAASPAPASRCCPRGAAKAWPVRAAPQ